ncbi:MAG: YfbK domain-containing protein [Luteolibacter sp.]
MSEETPHYHVHGDEALEARIVAWVLGESSPFEAEELKRLCAERPELEIFRRRIHAVHGLLGDAEKQASSPQWKLSSEKRDALNAVLGAPASEPIHVIFPKKRRYRAWLSAAASLAILVALAGLLAPMTMRQRKKSDAGVAAHQARMMMLETDYPSEYIEGTPVPINPESLLSQREQPRRAASQPSSAQAKVIAGTTASPTPIPVPEIAVAEASIAFGDAEDFGGGWGGGALAQNVAPAPADMPASGRPFAREDSDVAIEHNLSAGYSSEYVYRGANLGADGAIPADQSEVGGILAQAGELRRTGRYEEARSILEPLALTDADARRELESLDDPIRTNPALTYEHTQNVDQVRRNLYLAEGHYNLGKFDDAKKAYEETLRIDPYNQAARRGMERVAARKSDYYRAAYDHTRAELLMEVENAWELAIPAEDADTTAPSILSTTSLSPAELAAATPEEVQALRELAETVEERRKVLAQIVRIKGITYTGEDTGARTALSTYHQLEQEKLQIESQIESLLRYDDDQLITYAAGLNLPDNTVRELTPKYLELQFQVSKLQLDGADSRELGEMKEKLNTLRTQMNEGVVNLRATLRAQLDLATDRLARVESVRNEARDQAIQRGLSAQDYTEAKAAYEADLRRLEEMQARLRKAAAEPKAPPVVPTTETSAATDPFSTFSLNVSDAAFVLARDAIRRGERPAPEQIRVEQFYNALDYGDPAPAAGEPVATHIEQTAHPVVPGRNLVRIAARVGSTGRTASQPLHLTLLVDQSGSMVRADRRAAMDNALNTLTGLLGENDTVHVIGFARQPRLIAEALPGNRASEIRTLVHQSAAEGGTNMEAALELAQQIAARHQKPGAQNRVVLLSDGAVNLGNADPTRLAERITEMRQQGIATDIAGIGSDGLNDALLAELARHGDGRYHIVTPETGDRLARDLAGAFRPAASDVKVQVVFNPERVGGWKLIGFEEHRLNTEDFRNDAVDAAELAAEEAGVAIYQVETLPQGRGEIGEVFIRFRDTTTGSIVERSWPLPYEANAPALDQARPSMQLATLALLTAEKLRGGPLGDSIDLTTHRPLIQALSNHYRHDPRAHELFEMISALSDR